jgi:deoxyribonucleoside regulator
MDALRRAETAIAVVAGEGKHPVARALVTSGICTVLVTDDQTASFLLGTDAAISSETQGGEANPVGTRTERTREVAP